MVTHQERRAASRPFFSICIPQYNRTAFLIELCRSLAGQTFRDFEVCISDDRSTDGRQADLLAFLEGSGLAYAYRLKEKNRRYDGNLRGAIELAQGDYCFLMGNDDALASPATLQGVHDDMARLGPAGVVITNYEDYTTGAKVERMRATENCGAGPGVAARHFRNFSFVSGVVLHRESAQKLTTDRWDGSEMYQMYLGCRMIAGGSPLLSLRRVTVRKDIQIPGQSVDSYAAKPPVWPCPIRARHLPLGKFGRVAVDAIAPYVRPDELQAEAERIFRQLYLFTYPYWVVEYRRVQSWPFALGICLGMRPRHVMRGVPLSWRRKAKLVSLYAATTLGGLAVPVPLFRRLQQTFFRWAKVVR
jgi:hypothetical protein